MDRKKDAQKYDQAGQSANGQNDFHKATIYFSRAMKLDKNNSNTLLRMANSIGNQERDESACCLYKSVVAMNPRNSFAYFNFGYSLGNLGKTEESIKIYQKAILLTPENSDIYYNLATMLARKGRYEEAQEHYRKVLKLKPSDAYQVSNNVGCLYFIQGMFTKASEEFQKSISWNRKFTPAYCNMSLVFFCEDKREEAVKYFESGMKTLYEDKNKTKTIKDFIKSYTSKKTGFEMEFESNEGSDEEKRTLLRTMINGVTEIITLLTEQINE